MPKQSTKQVKVQTVVIGGGQAGLATGYHLTRLGREHVILDAGDRVGDSWRNRWDSLRLFTPAKFNGLPGMRFPAKRTSFPTKDEMADFLETYAERFELPVRTGYRVERLARNGDGFVVSAGGRRIVADNVVVASGAHQVPRIPACANELDDDIVQLHSNEYHSPDQLQDGGTLIVGVGNSGAEIALDVAHLGPTWLSGTPSAQLPFKHGPMLARTVMPVIRFMGHRVMTVRTPMGRKIRPKFIKMAAPLIRTKTKHLEAAGVERVGRTVGAEGGLPVVEGDRVLDVANVVWCTGHFPGFDWIDLPIIGSDGQPRQRRGVVEGEPGLYFVGLKFQYAMSSDVILGVGRDAKYVAEHLAARTPSARTANLAAA